MRNYTKTNHLNIYQKDKARKRKDTQGALIVVYFFAIVSAITYMAVTIGIRI